MPKGNRGELHSVYMEGRRKGRLTYPRPEKQKTREQKKNEKTSEGGVDEHHIDTYELCQNDGMLL